jgi:hypothetical protein
MDLNTDDFCHHYYNFLSTSDERSKQYLQNILQWKFQTVDEFKQYFKHNVKWGWLSFRVKLTEQFIREYKDYLDWRWISRYQVLSKSLQEEFHDRLDHEEIRYFKSKEYYQKQFNISRNNTTVPSL